MRLQKQWKGHQLGLDNRLYHIMQLYLCVSCICVYKPQLVTTNICVSRGAEDIYFISLPKRNNSSGFVPRVASVSTSWYITSFHEHVDSQ